MTDQVSRGMRISPNYGPEKTAGGRLEDFVDVYQDRVEGWILTPAERLLEDVRYDVAAFAIILSYFEPHGANILGISSHNNSSRCFKAGFLDVFSVYRYVEKEGDVDHHTLIELPPGADPRAPKQVPQFLNDRLDALYSNARCGIYHAGLIRAGVFLQRHRNDSAVAIEKATGNWFIDVRNVAKSVRAHLQAYVQMLRGPEYGHWRERFLSAWQQREPSSWPTPPAELP